MSVNLNPGYFWNKLCEILGAEWGLNKTAAAQLLAMILKSIDIFNGWMQKDSGLVYASTVTRVWRENKDPAGFTTDRRRFVCQSIWEWLKDQEQSMIRLCERDNVGNHCLKNPFMLHCWATYCCLIHTRLFFHSSQHFKCFLPQFYLQIKWFTLWWAVECLRSVGLCGSCDIYGDALCSHVWAVNVASTAIKPKLIVHN